MLSHHLNDIILQCFEMSLCVNANESICTNTEVTNAVKGCQYVGADWRL